MAGLSAPGIGSNLDVNSLVSQLMAVERQPLAALDTKEASYQAQLSAYGNLKSALSTFQSTMQGLKDSSRFLGLNAGVGDSSVLSASASSNAAPSTYSIEVSQLAQAQKVNSAAYANTTDVVGTGTLTIQFGTYDSAANTFTLNSQKAAQSITIDAAHQSLAGVRDAINNANVGVTASIVNDGTGNRLVLGGGSSGAANSMKITVSDADGNNLDSAGLSKLAYDPTAAAGSGKNMVQNQAAQNALFKVDGLQISKDSNTVTDVIQGVTLNLLKTNVGSPTSLNVSRDTAGLKSAVDGFVKAYNDLYTTIKNMTAYDATAKKGAILQGEQAPLSIMTQIRSTLSNVLQGVSGPYSQLPQVGVTLQKDGTMAVDSAKLDLALKGQPEDIAGLFAQVGKSSDSLVQFVSAGTASLPGSYAVSVSALATQGVYGGAGVLPAGFATAVTVDTTNNTFRLKVNGTSSGTITLAQGSYTSGASLAAEIQTKINGDSALKAAGASVNVNYDSAANRLVVTSDKYGSASTVEFTSVGSNTAATLGFSVGAGITGTDVAGTLDGVAAVGSGQDLTGASSATSDLKIKITGGALGSRGSIDLSHGYAFRLADLADKLLNNQGPIGSSTDMLNANIKDIGSRRDVLQRRMDDVERRYRAQFTALDMMIGQMRQTSDYLTQQLASLATLK